MKAPGTKENKQLFFGDDLAAVYHWSFFRRNFNKLKTSAMEIIHAMFLLDPKLPIILPLNVFTVNYKRN